MSYRRKGMAARLDDADGTISPQIVHFHPKIFNIIVNNIHQITNSCYYTVSMIEPQKQKEHTMAMSGEMAES